MYRTDKGKNRTVEYTKAVNFRDVNLDLKFKASAFESVDERIYKVSNVVMEVPNSNLLFKVDLERLSDPDSTESDEDTCYRLDAFDVNS